MQTKHASGPLLTSGRPITTNHNAAKLTALARRFLEYRRLPLALALAAIIFMLPALWAGLIGDDLIQRLRQLTPTQWPPRQPDTWVVPSNSGTIGGVVWHLFDLVRPGEDASARAILPWWTPEALKISLWRPFTAFTHWLDYRLFPNTPVLMHAHSIAWYALAVFLAATLYRRIAASPCGGGLLERPADSRAGLKLQPGVWVAGLAAGLFLLDKNTYVPVLYVANRGFIISLAFGLVCLHAHLRWRTTRSMTWMWLSALCLLLSLLANEGGASTLAFLMAYALVLEPGGWRPRLTSLLPAAAVVLGWRAVYVGAGFGVRNFLLYIDPGYEPLVFLQNLAPRVSALLGGQLTGLPPEVIFALNATWRTTLALFFAGFSLVCAVVFLPILRRDRVARFWAAVTLLALVPAATVYPLSKNLGFVAVGAFGVIASFLARFAAPQERAVMRGPFRALSWCVAGWLVLAHIPGALGGRVALGLASPFIPAAWEFWCDVEAPPEVGGRDVVALNDFTVIMVPFDRAYRGRPLPRTITLLVPGMTRFEVKRADASTLILTAKGSDLFDCPDLGPIHAGYALKAANDLLFGGNTWKMGDRVTRKGFVAQVLAVSARGAPREMAFHFDQPLESEQTVWLFFDWRRKTTLPFVPPRIGETTEIAGPSRCAVSATRAGDHATARPARIPASRWLGAVDAPGAPAPTTGGSSGFAKPTRATPSASGRART